MAGALNLLKNPEGCAQAAFCARIHKPYGCILTGKKHFPHKNKVSLT
jgi:hypothetical protein